MKQRIPSSSISTRQVPAARLPFMVMTYASCAQTIEQALTATSRIDERTSTLPLRMRMCQSVRDQRTPVRVPAAPGPSKIWALLDEIVQF